MGKTTHYQNNLLFSFFLFLISSSAFAQVFDTSGAGTYTVPAGVYQLTVEAWGAGGSGGTRSTNGYSGGGGGGAYVRSVLNVTPGTTYNLSVGAGSNGTQPGQDSWFGTATTVLAKGGNSVANNSTSGASGGSVSASVGVTKYGGGNGSNALSNYGGGGGSSAGPSAAGNSTSTSVGANPPIGGGKGANGRNSNSIGYPGSNPGGGGGGTRRTGGNGSTTKYGGDGGTGQIILTPNFREINVIGNATNIISGSTTTNFSNFTNFGSANITGQTATRTFTIQNLGNISLSVGAVTISGTHASNFVVTTSPGPTVAGGASTNFIVKFDPNATGTRNAMVSIVNNDPNENPYTFAISGYGSNPEIELKGNSIVIPNGQVVVSASNNT